MASITSQKDAAPVQRLKFCYLCGKEFGPDDDINRDHVPPENIFLPADRDPLWLPTHIRCNTSYGRVDEKIGQLIALRYGKVPSKLRNRKLRFMISADRKHGAVINLNIDDAVWRWVKGFHAALYSEPLCFHTVGSEENRALVTPFPRARRVHNRLVVDQPGPQHLRFVERLKLNRAYNNLDRVTRNNNKLIYECVWYRADGNGPWLCIFGLDIYDWKDLGRTHMSPARGCAGYYVLTSGGVPQNATAGVASTIVVPNRDPLDPFGP